MAMFTKYKKTENETKMLLMYLILNNYDLSKIQKIEEVVIEQMFGLELRKIYGVTSEYVDVQKIYKELANIRIPVVCSSQSFEMYSNEEVIYEYIPKEQEKSLYINDMGIISPLMIITENYIVSSNLAVPLEDADNKGFMYFVDYVLKGKCEIGAWEITYKSNKNNKCNEFCVYYSSEKNGEIIKERLYNALELDQTSTYKITLYIIGKAVRNIDEFLPDNFEKTPWELEMKKHE